MADIQFNLRIPEELKEKIKEAASNSGRSINAEAQLRLEESFKDKKYTREDIMMSVQGYLSGFYEGSAAAYKSRIDAIIAEHGENPENPSDRLLLQVLKILHSHYADNTISIESLIEKSVL